jgi:Flp pilus assembly protein TadG
VIHSRPRSRREEAGQALVEFALVLLFVILPFMFVLVDGAMTLYTYAMVTNAAREGARAASIYQTTSSPSSGVTCDNLVAAIDSARLAYARQQMSFLVGNTVPLAQCSTNITYQPNNVCLHDPAWPDDPSVPNPYRELDSLRVDLQCPRPLFFGLIGTRQITLSATSMMRIEPGGVPPSP